MRRYLVFAGAVYYPCGGGLDLFESFDDLKEAITIAEEQEAKRYSWAHVFDAEKGKIVWPEEEL